MREPLEQVSSATLDEPRPTVDDEVFLQARRMDLRALDREGDPWIARHVLQLPLVGAKVTRHDLVAFEADPDAGELRRAVGIQRHEVRERPETEEPERAVR